MRAIIAAHLIMWGFTLCALVPFYLMASEALSACELRHSYETCIHTLR